MPIPVVLDVSEKFIEPLSVGKQITLRTTDMTPLAILTISEIWQPNLKEEAQAVYGSCDQKHPGVDYLLNATNPFYISGKLQKIALPQYADFKELRYTPDDLKNFFKENKWEKIVAFQTRNPMHRAHVNSYRKRCNKFFRDIQNNRKGIRELSASLILANTDS